MSGSTARPGGSEGGEDRGAGAARAALALNPDSVDARLQLAVVYGMRGRRASLAEAFARNYAPRGRRLIDEALALAPDSAEAEAVLGAWHLEIIRRSGRVGALAYGARVEQGIAAFERALQLPDLPLDLRSVETGRAHLRARVRLHRERARTGTHPRPELPARREQPGQRHDHDHRGRRDPLWSEPPCANTSRQLDDHRMARGSRARRTRRADS